MPKAAMRADGTLPETQSEITDRVMGDSISRLTPLQIARRNRARRLADNPETRESVRVGLSKLMTGYQLSGDVDLKNTVRKARIGAKARVNIAKD